MICGATAGEAGAPAWQPQSRQAGLKSVLSDCCWYMSSSELQSYSKSMLKSMNEWSGLSWIFHSNVKVILIKNLDTRLSVQEIRPWSFKLFFRQRKTLKVKKCNNEQGVGNTNNIKIKVRRRKQSK